MPRAKTRRSEIADDKTSTLANAKRALLSVVARNCNTGFTYFAIAACLASPTATDEHPLSGVPHKQRRELR